MIKFLCQKQCQNYTIFRSKSGCPSNEQYYACQICWSIIHGALDPDLQLVEVGLLCHSTWLTLGGKILRYYVYQDKPNLTLASSSH